MLDRRGFELARKTFAVGARIEHLQADIDRAQYGPAAGHPALGAAPYKLVAHTKNGRSLFSFCMCPGGEVVAAASEAGGVVTNGASLHARAGKNANAALLVNVNPQDLPGDDVLAGIQLQRECERMAYELGGGAYKAPAQLVGDFLCGIPSVRGGKVTPTYPRGVTWGCIEWRCPSTLPRPCAWASRSSRVAFVVSMTRKPCSPAWRRAPAPPSPWCATAPATPRRARGSTLAARVRATRAAWSAAPRTASAARNRSSRTWCRLLSDVARR